MSKLSLVRDVRFQEHKTPAMHPESPQRLKALDQALEANALGDAIEQLSPRPATEDEVASVHSAAYVEEMSNAAQEAEKSARIIQIDADTFLSGRTYELALLAAGAGIVGIESIANGPFASSFVAVRPPGHHALFDKAMGFCFFNNIAVAARHAQRKLGFKRIMIIDWDVHHGNGTQAIFYDDPSVLFVSFHQYPFWPPDSGWYTEDGVGDGKGFNINIPLPAGTGDRGYLSAWDAIVKPVCLSFKPDLILLSAGYDAHQLDPLGQQRISTAGFAMLSQRLLDLSLLTGAKLVCFLEGGYNVKSLSDSAVATMRVLNTSSAEENADVHVSYLVPGAASGADAITDDRSPSLVDERISEVRSHFAKYWPELR